MLMGPERNHKTDCITNAPTYSLMPETPEYKGTFILFNRYDCTGVVRKYLLWRSVQGCIGMTAAQYLHVVAETGKNI